eukprot:gene14159-15638_t
MQKKLRLIHLLYIVASFAITRLQHASAIDMYIQLFDDFRIKEKTDPLPVVTRDLQYSGDYIRNPCKLAEVGEIAPMLAIDELQRQYKMVLEGYLLTTCLVRMEFGKEKAEKIIDKWLSGYENLALKRIQEQNLKSVLDIAESAITQQQCHHWVVMATRYGDFDVPGSSTVQTIIDYMTDKLEIAQGSLARLGPAASSITLKCMQMGGNLSTDEQQRLSGLFGVGMAFTYELVGGVMSRVLGHHGSADLLRVIAHELNKASYLERDEIKKRVRFLVSGYRQSDLCKTLKSDLDCIEAVESDFTMHTPMYHMNISIAVAARINQTSSAAHEVNNKKPLESVLSNSPDVMMHLEDMLQPHRPSHPIAATTPHQHHHNHLLISGDKVMQQLQRMDNPLVTA